MEKIKFKRCDVMWKNHEYCVLIPYDVENMHVYDFGGEEGTGWVGNRKVVKTLMYAAAILGFNPTNKIIYFPIRGNEPPEFYSWADRCDLIFTTHQVQLKRSDWNEIRNTLKYMKEKTYVLQYDSKRTEAYFTESIECWKKTEAAHKKEYLIEVMEEDTLFQVYSRKQFQIICLALQEFLQRPLEQELLEDQKHGMIPYDFMGLEYPHFWYRNKKWIGPRPFIDYYDERVIKRDKALRKKEKKKAV